MTAKALLPHDIPIGGLISIIFRTQAIFLNHHLRSLGLSCGQFPVLMFLKEHQNVTQETLARHFHIDRGTIARSVKKLEDAGYVIRNIDPDNRRAVKLFLSEKGVSIISDLIRIDTEWEMTASSRLNEEEMTQFKDLLWRVAFASIKGVNDIGENSFASCCSGGECA
ncbi:MAG TPA: MarR family transcriptional regulator [Methanospirillum sp.]|uniref:MarR family winged helix-turn-helix transcriptional regulator n=1 Tax=Methanospirillum sp. TaxID=45200 RepID=UPI002C8FB3C3|nr:MarR family transcriptional regulator [Methanospirillum sp.]HWQ63890.1 MarR family transcriptional regulator [Methanospirillum sp.]